MRLFSLIFALLILCSACSEKTVDYGVAPDSDPVFAMQMAQEHVARQLFL